MRSRILPHLMSLMAASLMGSDSAPRPSGRESAIYGWRAPLIRGGQPHNADPRHVRRQSWLKSLHYARATKSTFPWAERGELHTGQHHLSA